MDAGFLSGRIRGAIMNSCSLVPADPCELSKGSSYNGVVGTAGCSAAEDILACVKGLDYLTFLNAADGSPFRTCAANRLYPEFKRLAAILGEVHSRRSPDISQDRQWSEPQRHGLVLSPLERLRDCFPRCYPRQRSSSSLQWYLT